MEKNEISIEELVEQTLNIKGLFDTDLEKLEPKIQLESKVI